MSNIILRLRRWLSRNVSGKDAYKFILRDWLSVKDIGLLMRVLETKRFTSNLEPVILKVPNARRVLVIAPHPDDEIISSGGTILKLVDSGADIKVIYLTSGEEIEKNTREQEALEVAKRLKTMSEFWHYTVHGIKADEGSKRRLISTLEDFEPQAVFIPFLSDDHPDHRSSNRFFYEALKDYKKLSPEIWAYQVYSTLMPNVVIDITQEVERKSELINLFNSQMKRRNWSHYAKGLNAMNSRFLRTSEARYAECFFVVPLKEYLNLCGKYFDEKLKKK